MSKVKTNAKSCANLPAIVYVKPNGFYLSLVYKSENYSLEKTYQPTDRFENLQKELFQAVGSPVSGQRSLVMVFSAELTLYSEQVFPEGLSEAEIQQLFEIQLRSRHDTGQINTYFVYFLLTSSTKGNLYGYFEVRKDNTQALIKQFEANDMKPICIIPQLTVLINHLIKNNQLNSNDYILCILLPARIYLARVMRNKVSAIKEHVNFSKCITATTIQSLIEDFSHGEQHSKPVLLLPMGCEFESGKMDQTYRLFSKNNDAKLIDSMTTNWLREQYDLYKSIAMA